jgi:imidazolonepropionase-like amidohydrolase
LHRELDLMVQAGLTPLQALTAATRGGAAVMGRPTDLGTVTPGKLADLVVLDGDPLADTATRSRSRWL